MNHLSDFCRICFIFIPSFLILISLSGSSLYWGWTRYDQCSCEPLLPQSLMGFGLLSSMSLIVALIFVRIKDVHSNTFESLLCLSDRYFFFQNRRFRHTFMVFIVCNDSRGYKHSQYHHFSLSRTYIFTISLFIKRFDHIPFVGYLSTLYQIE